MKKWISNTPDKNGTQIVTVSINDKIIYEQTFKNKKEAKIAFEEQCEMYGLSSQPPKTKLEKLQDWFRKLRGIKEDV